MTKIKKYGLAVFSLALAALGTVVSLPAHAALTASSGEEMLNTVGGSYFDTFMAFVTIIFTKYIPIVIGLVVIASLVGLGYWFIHKITGHK
jgi:hypothetical protein